MWSNHSVIESANLVMSLLSSPSAQVVAHGEHLGFEELVDRVGTWAGHLASTRAPASRIGVLSGNDHDFVVAYLACLTAGMVAVPLNPLSPGPERAHDLTAVGAAEILVGRRLAGMLGETEFGVPVTQLDPAAAQGGPIDPRTEAADVEPDAVAALLFTSGTAGPSKPAMLTHRNFRASLLSIEATGVDLRSSPQVSVSVIPLFHIFGLNVIINLGLRVGAMLDLRETFDPADLVHIVGQDRGTILAGPPNLWHAISHLDVADTEPLRHLTVALSGAAPLDPGVARSMREQHHVDLREGYGLTETCGVLCSGFGADAVEVGSVGPIMPGVECRLVDSEGQDVLIGDVGEVWVKGPMISPGYWEDEPATRRSRTEDGWFRTGDLAVVDDHGHLSITGRIKDLVIVSGFNVHPAEVEQVLQSHPAVAAAAVVGIPDENTGERVRAFVVLHDGGAAPDLDDELRRHCIDRLARYKVPVGVEIVDTLPVGVAGKLKRRDLAG